MAVQAGGVQSKLSAVRSLVWLAIMLGLGVASAVWLAPSVLTDLQIRNPEPTAGRLASGRCQNRTFVHVCDATLRIQTKNGPVERETHFAFFDLKLGDYTTEVVADRDRPELVSTSLALDHLWNRVVTLLVFWAIVLAVLFQAVRSRLGSTRQAAAGA